MKNFNKYFGIGILVAFLVFIDQYTKYLIVNRLGMTKEIPVLKGIISFKYLENDGIAFSFLSGKTFIINAMGIFFTAVIIYMLFVLQRNINNLKSDNSNFYKKLNILQVLISFVIAGSVGNIIDRIRLGYVVDFIKTDFIDFPVFNVADCYVTVSVFFIFVILIFMKDDEFKLIKFRR
ncbi:MAG: signal peptidase II [Lachnospiraceae bacterium]|nr:signal peptidase II [Lachnospiraceae bacterium]